MWWVLVAQLLILGYLIQYIRNRSVVPDNGDY